MPHETNTVHTTAAVPAPDNTSCDDFFGLEFKMEQEIPRSEQSPPSQPTLSITDMQEITCLPDDVIAGVPKRKGLTYKEIWQSLKERPISEKNVSALKSNALWMPLFKECFPAKQKLQNEAYCDAFEREYKSLMAAVTQDGWALEFASEPLKNDEAIVLAAIAQDDIVIEFASKALQDNPELQIIASIENNEERAQACRKYLEDNRQRNDIPKESKQHDSFQASAAPELPSPRRKNQSSLLFPADNEDRTPSATIERFKAKGLRHQEIWQLLKGHPISEKDLSALKSDTLWRPLFKECFPAKQKSQNEAYFDAFEREYQSLIAAVTQKSWALESASEPLQNDKEVVMAAVKQYSFALRYASETLQSDKEVVMAAVRQEGNALQYASKTLQNDKEVVMAAVTQYGGALQYASEALKNDEEIVMAAVAQSGLARVYASKTLKNNPKLKEIAETEDDEARAQACRDYLPKLRQAKNQNSLLLSANNEDIASSATQERGNNICAQLIFGFAAVAGAATVAVAFLVLSAATLGAAGLITAGVGSALLATGSIGLFKACRNNHSEAEDAAKCQPSP